jgi:hypothetical protein
MAKAAQGDTVRRVQEDAPTYALSSDHGQAFFENGHSRYIRRVAYVFLPRFRRIWRRNLSARAPEDPLILILRL